MRFVNRRLFDSRFSFALLEALTICFLIIQHQYFITIYYCITQLTYLTYLRQLHYYIVFKGIKLTDYIFEIPSKNITLQQIIRKDKNKNKNNSMSYLKLNDLSKRITIGFNKYAFSQSDILGKGATGYVYKGVRCVDGFTVAIKAIDLVHESWNQVTKALLQSQKKALQMLSLSNKNNPHVLKLYDIIYQNNFCYIISQFCGSKTLKNYLQQKGKLTQEEAHEIFRKILIGYCSIIDSCIIHRDLKPANIMMRQKNVNNSQFQRENSQHFNVDNFQKAPFEPVIIDFGYCEIIKHKTTMTAYNVGSPTYMSPQAYLKTLYSQKSDMWALGVILFQMITGQTPDNFYLDKDIKKFFQKIKEQNGSLLELLKFKQAQKLKQINFSSVTEQLLQSSLKIVSNQRCSSHRLKYILDKQMINKLNSKNSVIKPKSTCFKSCVYNNFCTKSSNHFQPSTSSSSVLLQNPKNLLQSGHFQRVMVNSKSRNTLTNSIQKIQQNQAIQAKSFSRVPYENYQSQTRNEQQKINDRLRLSTNFEFSVKLTQSRYKQKSQNYSNILRGSINSQHKYTILPAQIPNIDKTYAILKAPYQQPLNFTEKRQENYVHSTSMKQNFSKSFQKEKENIEIYNRNTNNFLKYQPKNTQNKLFQETFKYIQPTSTSVCDTRLGFNKNSTNNNTQNNQKWLKSSIQKDYRQQKVVETNQKYFSFKNNNIIKSQHTKQQGQFFEQRNQYKIPIQKSSYQKEKEKYEKFNNSNDWKNIVNLPRPPNHYHHTQNLPSSSYTSMHLPTSTYNFNQTSSPPNLASHYTHQPKFMHLRL